MNRYEGKKVVVIGGTSGMGLATAKMLLDGGALSPGPVDTPMFDGQFPSEEGAAEARKQITAMIPLARLVRTEEIASAALFLASDQSSYVAGIDLAVDGGLTAI